MRLFLCLLVGFRCVWAVEDGNGMVAGLEWWRGAVGWMGDGNEWPIRSSERHGQVSDRVDMGDRDR